MAQTTVDFAAVGRVSRFAELKDIRLTAVSAKGDPNATGPLEAEFAHNCSVAGNDNTLLSVSCDYKFAGTSGEEKSIDIGVTYIITYTLSAPEPLPESDILQFAIANGTLHSWPFVREFLHGLTSRMGFPPFKLGVMHFAPKPKPQAKKESSGGEAKEGKKIPTSSDNS